MGGGKGKGQSRGTILGTGHFAESGRTFYDVTELSKLRIPVISVVFGSSTAGGAYQPGLSDYVIGIKNNGMAALAGPALLKAATGEIAKNDELGGSEMHSRVTGLVEYLADDDAHAIEIVRDLINKIDWNSKILKRESIKFQEPMYDCGEIIGIVPIDYKVPYDVRELIARIVDGSDFMDFKPQYGVSTVCVHTKINGFACGIIGNNGPIDPNGATKSAQFIQLCDQSDTPLIFLSNTTGFMVGKQTEQLGMIKHGSKLIQAVSNVRVPRITLNIGASFGAGNYGMCGRGYDPDFLYTFPNARTGVMGGEQAAKTMSVVARGKAKTQGIEVDEEILKQQESMLTHMFDSQSDAFYTSGHMMDDGMIDPRDMRKTIGMILETIEEGRKRALRPNSFGVARL